MRWLAHVGVWPHIGPDGIVIVGGHEKAGRRAACWPLLRRILGADRIAMRRLQLVLDRHEALGFS